MVVSDPAGGVIAGKGKEREMGIMTSTPARV